MQTSTDSPKKTPRAARAAPVVETKAPRRSLKAAAAAAAKPAKAPKVAKAPKATAPVAPAKGQTKAAQVVALLNRKQGATNQEIMDATGWQTHSVRGFLAHLKKGGTKIEKTVDGKTSTYRIVADEAV